LNPSFTKENILRVCSLVMIDLGEERMNLNELESKSCVVTFKGFRGENK